MQAGGKKTYTNNLWKMLQFNQLENDQVLKFRGLMSVYNA